MPEKRMTAQHGMDKDFVESHSDWLRDVVSVIVHELIEAEVRNMLGLIVADAAMSARRIATAIASVSGQRA